MCATLNCVAKIAVSERLNCHRDYCAAYATVEVAFVNVNGPLSTTFSRICSVVIPRLPEIRSVTTSATHSLHILCRIYTKLLWIRHRTLVLIRSSNGRRFNRPSPAPRVQRCYFRQLKTSPDYSSIYFIMSGVIASEKKCLIQRERPPFCSKSPFPV